MQFDILVGRQDRCSTCYNRRVAGGGLKPVGCSMERIKSGLSKHDTAYLCFLLPSLLSLIARIGSLFPMDTGTSGALGFLVLIPLALASLYFLPYGIYLSFVHRQDKPLLVLAALSIAWVVLLLTEAGPPWMQNLAGFAYGIAAIALIGDWFWRRRRVEHGVG